MSTVAGVPIPVEIEHRILGDMWAQLARAIDDPTTRASAFAKSDAHYLEAEGLCCPGELHGTCLARVDCAGDETCLALCNDGCRAVRKLGSSEGSDR